MSTTLEPKTRSALRPVRFLDSLEVARRGFRVYLGGSAFGLAVLMAGLVGAGVMLLDCWVILPAATRLMGLTLVLAAAVASLIRPISRFLRLRTGDAATAIERAFPEIGQRLTTSLDYVEPSESTVPARPSLVEALVEDTDHRTQSLDLDRLVPWGRLAAIAAVLLVGTIALAVSLALSPDLRIAAQRLLLLPVHYTQLEIQPGDRQVKEGEDLKIDVAVQGRPVRQLELRYRPKTDAPWTRVSLVTAPAAPDENTPAPPPEPVSGTVSTTLRKLQSDFEYQVQTGEIVSPTYRVQVVHPLHLKEAVARVTPPAYTKRKPASQPQGSLRVIEGSRVRLEFALDRAPAKAWLEITEKRGDKANTIQKPLATAVKPPGSTAAKSVSALELASVNNDLEYRMLAESAEGLRLESPKYRIRVLPDEKPTVKFVEPAEPLEVTPLAEVPLIVSSADDFGVSKLGIVVQVAGGPRETLRLEDFKTDAPPTAEAIAQILLEKHDVKFTDEVTYFGFVEDNYPGKPHRVTTDLRFIDIRPYRREFQLVKGGGCPCSGNSVTLEELIARQRQNLKRSFAQLDVPSLDDETLARLEKTETELHAATKEFADGLAAKFGEVAPLVEAVKAMEAAVEQLQTPDMPAAVESQGLAVTSLVRARKNLKQLLKEQSQSQCEACRKFDQQQEQRLRPPPKKKTEDQQEQLGDDVAKLAKKQKRFSEELASRSSGAKLPQDSQPQNQKKKSSSSSSSSSSQSQSESQESELQEDEPEMLKKKQDESAGQAEQLSQRVARDESLTKLARERMEAGEKAIRESAESLKSGDQKSAAEAAKKAAEQLENLAQQIAGLKTPDLSSKVGKARDLAQDLAGKQGDLSRRMAAGDKQPGDGSASPTEGKTGETSGGDSKGGASGSQSAEQRRLAEQAKTLGDLLNRLRTDAADENGELSQSLSRAVGRHPPADSAQKMEQAAAQLEQGDRPGAARDAAEAAKDLSDLATALDAAHHGLVRETLDQLLAAEKQAAEAEKSLTSAKSEADKGAAEARLQQLTQSLNKIPQAGTSVSEASDKLAAAGLEWSQDKDPRGNYVVPSATLNGLKRTIQALQARIQELILKDAVLDRDGAVPPEYKTLVEQYYKALSEDLR